MIKEFYGFKNIPGVLPGTLVAALFIAAAFSLVSAECVLAQGGKGEVKAELVPASDYYYDLGPGNAFFLENWSNTTRINADDNWLSVFSIFGYNGDYSAADPTGVNPQTLLQDLSGPPKVKANQSNPNTLTPEGIAEFDGIADPVVALKGGPTADAPHLDIRMNMMGCDMTKTINFSYKVRDIDGSANNAVQPVATQYRIGDTGPYTNLPFGFIADATTGPNQATQMTNVFVNLPSSVLLQPKVHLRILTTNAAGNDEWIGIDDISVRCVAPTGASVSLGGRVMSTSGRGLRGVTVFAFGANMEEPVSTVTGPFGYYQFDGMQAGENYIVSVSSKRYVFEATDTLVNLTDSMNDVNFYAEGR